MPFFRVFGAGQLFFAWSYDFPVPLISLPLDSGSAIQRFACCVYKPVISCARFARLKRVIRSVRVFFRAFSQNFLLFHISRRVFVRIFSLFLRLPLWFHSFSRVLLQTLSAAVRGGEGGADSIRGLFGPDILRKRTGRAALGSFRSARALPCCFGMGFLCFAYSSL